MQIKSSIKQVLPSLILLGSLLTGTVACKKDKNDSPSPPAPGAKIQEYKNGEDFVRFEYNPDGTVKKATLKNDLNTNGNIIDYNIAYNAEKKIASVITTAGEKIIPEYQNGVLIRAHVFDGDEKTGYTNYLYENNLLTRATLYWGSGTEFEPFFEFNFEYNNAGNVTKTILMMATNVLGQMTRVGHIEYQYDEKTNPLYVHKELLAFLCQAVSSNNIKQEDHYDADLELEDRYIYTYTYKANGLPEHAEVKIGLPGQPPVISGIDFIYR